MRATLLLSLAALAAARELAAGPVVGEGAVATSLRSLPPFSALELGRQGCMPISVRVAEGSDFGVEVTAQARASGHTP